MGTHSCTKPILFKHLETAILANSIDSPPKWIRGLSSIDGEHSITEIGCWWCDDNCLKCHLFSNRKRETFFFTFTFCVCENKQMETKREHVHLYLCCSTQTQHTKQRHVTLHGLSATNKRGMFLTWIFNASFHLTLFQPPLPRLYILHFQMFALTVSSQADEKTLAAPSSHPPMQCVLHLRYDGCSVTLPQVQQRSYSGHFSSFLLCLPGRLLTLSLFCLINGTISPVAVVIKSNEVSNGWGFVESAVGNWGGGCLRWGSMSALCPRGNEIVFHFSLRQS